MQLIMTVMAKLMRTSNSSVVYAMLGSVNAQQGQYVCDSLGEVRCSVVPLETSEERCDLLITIVMVKSTKQISRWENCVRVTI